MPLEYCFDDPLYWGQSGISAEVPGTFDVAIAGHPYMIDTTFEFGRRDSFRHSSIPAQRDATDITNQPGEATINPQGLWRSEFNDWSMGSGQLFVDRKDSFPNRYHHSQGVDAFTNKWYLGMLPDTEQLVSDTDPTCQILVVNGYIYKMNSSGVSYSTDGVNYSPVGGLPSPPVCMCDDGATVYIACGAGGVYSTVSGSSSSSVLVNVFGQNIYYVAFCSNVLLVANGPSLYQVSSFITTFPTALITQPQASWTWNSACGGNGWIYLGGFAGVAGNSTVSSIYKTQFAADGTALSAPTVATPLPPGESVYSMFAFVNYILIGTSLGMRFCQTLGVIDPSGQDTGLLKIGPIIPNLQELVTKPVKCFTANQRFVYFGWSNYSDSTVDAISSPVVIEEEGAFVTASPATVPVTITMGVNDQFVFTPIATGVPDTFTIAPGTYSSWTSFNTAIFFALGTGSVAFGTICNVDTAGSGSTQTVSFYAITPGETHNGDTITEGNGGAAAIGFTGPPYTFEGGFGPITTGGSEWTGIGWLDISTFTGDQTPAYSSNLMVQGLGEVTSMDWWNGAPIFTVAGQGVFTKSPNFVPQGTVYSGFIAFRIPDQKSLVAYSVDTTSTSGSVSVSIDHDGEGTVNLGTSSGSSTVFSIPQTYGELFETALTLNSVNSNTVGTTVRRATLQAYPGITAGKFIITALRFWDTIETKAGNRQMNVYSELAFLEQLRATQQVFTYQEGDNSWQVVMDSLDAVWYQPSTQPTGGFNGIIMATMKTADSGLLT